MARKRPVADRDADVAVDEDGNPIEPVELNMTDPVTIGEKIQHVTKMLQEKNPPMTDAMRVELFKQLHDIGQYLIDVGKDPDNTEPITL